MLEIYDKLLKQVDNRARFLSCVFSGDFKILNRAKKELRQEFVERGFDPLPKEGQPAAVGATGDKKSNGESPDVDAGDYDYLTSMSVSSFSEEYLQHLLELKNRLEIKVGLLRKATPQFLKSERGKALLDTNYKKAQSGRVVMVDMAAKDSKVSEAAPRRRHKRTAAESLEASAMLMDDEEEEAPKLKDQSQEQTETECSQKHDRKKQRKRRKKQSKESSEAGAPKHCCRALDFGGHDKSGDGFLVEEIKRISTGLDGIELTHRNRGHSMVGGS